MDKIARTAQIFGEVNAPKPNESNNTENFFVLSFLQMLKSKLNHM
jgi:hypothetical protein